MNNSPNITIRAGCGDDADFLRAMVYEAAHWRPDGPRPPLVEALEREDLSKLLAEWGGRPGDTAVIAVARDGAPVGAAWYRFWTRDDHSYGFVAEEVPELGIAVKPDWRGRGVGRGLLAELLRQARSHGIRAVSLSVEHDNPARRLYESAGFRKIGAAGHAWTMLAEL